MTIVLADDLTSAAEAAGQLAAAGGRAEILLTPRPARLGVTACLDLDSRAVSPSLAAARCAEAVQCLLPADSAGPGRPQLYKTMDSSLRGNWAVELAATMRAARRSVAVVAPAYPAYRRSTVDGVQYADGVRVDLGPAGRDPVRPVTGASVHAPLIAAGLRTARTRPGRGLRDTVARLLADAGAGAGHALVVDAGTDADLAVLAAAVGPYTDDIVLSGSPGLWEALHPASVPPIDRTPRSGAVLVVVGSLHATTRRQLAWLTEHGVPALTVHATDAPDDIAGVVAHAFAGGEPVVALRTPEPAGPAGGAALPRLAAAAACVADRAEFGLVLTGGDTARAVTLALGTHAIEALGTVAPGIPVGRLSGPRPHPVVCKAGGFGAADVLEFCVRTLTRRSA